MNVSLENLKRNKNYFKWILWSFVISILFAYMAKTLPLKI